MAHPDLQPATRPPLTLLALTAVLIGTAAVASRAAAEPNRPTAPTTPAGPDFVWIEGEKPTASNLEVSPASNGHPEWLSDGKWLFVGIEAKDVEQKLPKGGAVARVRLRRPEGRRLRGLEPRRHGVRPLAVRLADRRRRLEDDRGRQGADDRPDGAGHLERGRLAQDGRPAPGQGRAQAGNPPAADEGRARARPSACSTPPTPSASVPGRSTRTPSSSPARATATRPTRRRRSRCSTCRRPPATPAAAGGEFGAAQGPVGGLPARRGAAGRGGRADQGLPRRAALEGDRGARRQERAAARPAVRPPALVSHARRTCRRDLPGRSFVLTFPQNNLNTTVYVNGVYCGFNKNPFVHFDIDVTKGIKPGQVNEVWVGIRDAWYGYSAKPDDPMKLRKKFNLPLDFVAPGLPGPGLSGLGRVRSRASSSTPTLTAAGPVYAADVFVKPRWRRSSWPPRSRSPTRRPSESAGEVRLRGGGRRRPAQVAKALPAKPFTVARRQGAGGRGRRRLGRRRSSGGRTTRTCTRCARPSRVGGKPVDVSRHDLRLPRVGRRRQGLHAQRRPLARLEHGRQRRRPRSSGSTTTARRTRRRCASAAPRRAATAVLRHVARRGARLDGHATAWPSAAAASSTARRSATWPSRTTRS